MSDFYYVNSENRTIDLSKAPYIGMRSNTLLDFEWQFITQGQAVQRIVKFEKQMVEKQFHVVVSGIDETDYYRNLDRFIQYTDVDIDHLTPGRLYVGKYYLRCYIYANTKERRYLGTNKSLISVSVVAENGNWQSEELFSYANGCQGTGYTTGGIDYKYDYNYDFAAPFDKNAILNESYMETDFELTFYGPYQNPSVEIGGNTYTIYYYVVSGEYIKINSQKKTVKLIKHNGAEENLFRYRDRDNYIFKKIRGGVSRVEADADLEWDIKLFYERSEPKWSSARWI